MAKRKKYSQQFKDDAVQYRKDHPELTRIQRIILISAYQH
ncbi:hypothetical protein CXIVA_12490 [Clostridium sp. SY8519]|nr:hypothetical protein CXIVA_12490 [Clostridium sp. SY8519]